MFKVGDKVVFDVHNGINPNTNRCLMCLGIVLNVNQDNTYHILYFDGFLTSIVYNISCRYMIPLESVESERLNIQVIYKNLINIEKKKLKTVSQEEKDKEKLKRYEDIKQRIIRNCEWLIDRDLDDEDFVNRVKEITKLKKQLFSPEKLPCLNEIHRHNGTIKYNIRELERERDKALYRISDEEIAKRFKNF